MLKRFGRKKQQRQQPLPPSNPPPSQTQQPSPPMPTKSLHELLNLHPDDDKQRSKYDDRAVVEEVRRNPEDAKRMYQFTAYYDDEYYPLEVAVMLGCSLEAAEALYEANPDAIQHTDSVGNTVLHGACRYKHSLKVAKFLVEKYPAALETKGWHGYTPLHYACCKGAPLEVVKMLLDRHPAALHMKDDSGDTPLMSAKKWKESRELIALLEKAEAAAASSSSSAVRPPLAIAAAAASLTTTSKTPTSSNRQGNPPTKSSSSTLDMFLPPKDLIHQEGGFEGAMAAAKEGNRWLLVNLQRDSDFSCHALNRDVWENEVVQNLVQDEFVFWQTMDNSLEGRMYTERYLVSAYPHVAIINPQTGKLMWRKEGWTQANPMTAEKFIAAAVDFCSRHPSKQRPTAAHEKPSTGMEPHETDKQKPAAQQAKESNEHRTLFDLLNFHPINHRSLFKNEPVLEAIRRDPQAAKGNYIFPAYNKSRRYTPLTMAVALGASLPVVKSLYTAWQEAIQETDFFGRTPLHFACLYQSSLYVITFLVDNYHPAIELEDSLGQTPLHVACTYGAPLKVVELLVDRYPAAINIITKSGETPLMLATRGKASGEVLQLLQKGKLKSDDSLTGAGTKEPSSKRDKDSDMHAKINDSEDDGNVDDDSGYDQADNYHVKSGKVVLTGAGIPAVNGEFSQSGSFDNVAKYSKKGAWNNREEEFSLFRCWVSDNTRRWYISIVPKNIQPGTNKDVDFYSAPVHDERVDYPPESGWITVKENGADPPPVVAWKPDPVDDDDGDDNEKLGEDTRTRARTGAVANEAGLGTDTTGQTNPPANNAPSEFSNEVISTLTDMGFDREKVLECLRKTNGDPTAAVDLLLNSSIEATNSASAESIQPGSAVTTDQSISGEEVHDNGAIAATMAHRTSGNKHSPAAGDVDIPTLTPSEWAALKALTANPREFDSCVQSTTMTLTPHDKEIIRVLSANLKNVHRVLESVRGLPATLVDKPDHVKGYFQIFTSGFERTYVAALALASSAVQGQLMSSNRRMVASVLETLGSITSGSNIPFLGFIAIFTSMGTHMLQQHESNMLLVFQEFFRGQSRDEYLLTYRAAAEQICLHPDYLSSYGDASCNASGLRTKIVHSIERVQKRLQRCHLRAIELLKPIELKAMDDLSTVTDSVLKLWSEGRDEYDELKQRNENDKADFVLMALGIDGSASCEVSSRGEQGCEEQRWEIEFAQHGSSSISHAGVESANDAKAETTRQLDILRHLEEQMRQNQELREEQKRQNQQLQRLEKENRDKSARMKFLERQVVGLGDEDEDVDIDVGGSGLQRQCRRSRQSKANNRTTSLKSGESTDKHASEVAKQVRELRQELDNVTDALERTRLGVFVANRLMTVLEAKLLVYNILLRSSDDFQERVSSSLIKSHSSIAADEKGCFTLNGNHYQIGKFRSRHSSWKGDLRIKIDQDHNGVKSVKSWFDENGLGFRFELHSKAVILEMFAKELGKVLEYWKENETAQSQELYDNERERLF